MSNQQAPSKLLHIALWVAQLLLAASLIWAATMKLFQPVEKLSAMWPWVGQVSGALVKVTGIVDLLGGIGLILPSLLRIKPQFTPIAAIGMMVLMVCASIFHIVRGEASSIGANIVFAGMAAFIAWGRWTKAKIAPK
jgi:uncharacterized membrane protein YphA (DoxX/SURF4 family)